MPHVGKVSLNRSWAEIEKICRCGNGTPLADGLKDPAFLLGKLDGGRARPVLLQCLRCTGPRPDAHGHFLERRFRCFYEVFRLGRKADILA